MDALTVGLTAFLSVLATAVLWRFTAVWRLSVEATRLVNEVALVNAQEKLARAEQARNAGQLGGRPRERHVQRKGEEEEEEEPAEPTKGERIAIQMAAGMGIDLVKLADDDPAELQKAQGLMARFGQQLNGGGQVSAGDTLGG